MYGNGNPSIANKLMSSFKSEMTYESFQNVASYKTMLEKGAVNRKNKTAKGLIVCGRTHCGSEDKIINKEK